MHGRIESQHALQKPQRSGGALGLCGHALCFLSRVFLRKIDEAHIVAPLRRADVNLLLKILIEQLFKKCRILHRLRQQDHLGSRTSCQIILLDERRDRVLLAVGRLQNFVFLVKKIPVHIVEHREARLGLALVISDHVGVCHRARGHELLLSERFHRPQPVAQHRGLLKV